MVFIFTESANLTRRAGAYRIATCLRNNYIEVETIDYLRHWNIDELLSLLDNFEIDWVGFSLTYLNYHKSNPNTITDLSAENETKLINYLRLRRIPIALGGANADTIKDYVENYWIFVGYSDQAVIEFDNHIRKQSPLEYTTSMSNKIIYADRSYNDITLDFKTKFVNSDFVLNNELLPIEISRGCIFKCKFCEFAYLGKKPGTYIRDKLSIEYDIVSAHNTFGTKNFLFVDDTFNDSIDKMRMIKSIRQDTGIDFEFWSYGRLDLMSRYKEMIDLMPEIGWNAVTFGIETMNKQTGSSIGKGANPAILKKTLVDIKQYHPYVHIQCNLIIGLPHSTKEDIWETVNWLLETNTADYLRVVDLDIRDPTRLSSASEFSLNPNKFGYKIISTDKLRYNWSNSNWSVDSAKEFASIINDYIDENKKNNYPYWRKYFIDNFNNVDSFLSKQDYVLKKIDHLRSLTNVGK